MTIQKPNITNRQRKYAIPVTHLERLSLAVFRRLGISAVHFNLVLSNDRAIRRLNRIFRHKDRSTDILSFPSTPRTPTQQVIENSSLGDMIISVETAYRQAIQQGHSLKRELDVLLIHGLLHLLGYDHETDQGQMRRKERLLRKHLLC